jgi:hypothetical protein
MNPSLRGSNGFDGAEIQKYLDTIDEADAELASALGSYRNSCKAPRARIKNAMKMAKGAGLNMTAFAEVVSVRRAKQKADARVAAMEHDDRDDYQAMVEALGTFADTPLGAAALQAHPGRGEEALDSLGTS